MQLIEEEIRRLVPTVWDAVLHLALEPLSTAPKDNRGMVSACVHITGAWNGAIALSCDTDFASQAASIMFDLAAVPPTTEEMQDALGELTNIVGGNVKALLPESCHLSLPAAVEGSDYSLRVLRSRVVMRVPFHCGDHSLSVTLFEREERAS